LGDFFQVKSNVLILAKKQGWATFGRFITNSSGHHGELWPLKALSVLPLEANLPVHRGELWPVCTQLFCPCGWTLIHRGEFCPP
jgi:hypothetical protein